MANNVCVRLVYEDIGANFFGSIWVRIWQSLRAGPVIEYPIFLAWKYNDLVRVFWDWGKGSLPRWSLLLLKILLWERCCLYKLALRRSSLIRDLTIDHRNFRDIFSCFFINCLISNLNCWLKDCFNFICLFNKNLKSLSNNWISFRDFCDLILRKINTDFVLYSISWIILIRTDIIILVWVFGSLFWSLERLIEAGHLCNLKLDCFKKS